jgi:hypothetical protein
MTYCISLDGDRIVQGASSYRAADIGRSRRRVNRMNGGMSAIGPKRTSPRENVSLSVLRLYRIASVHTRFFKAEAVPVVAVLRGAVRLRTVPSGVETSAQPPCIAKGAQLIEADRAARAVDCAEGFRPPVPPNWPDRISHEGCFLRRPGYFYQICFC